MNPIHAILWGAVGGLIATWLTRKGATFGSLSVTGGTVSIDNSDAVEERPAYRYLGETTELFEAGNIRSPQWKPRTMPLVNGRIYDVIPVVKIQGEPLAMTKDRQLGTIDLIVRGGGGSGIPRGRWELSWAPVVLTVQEQVANQMVIVPNWCRPDDTEKL